MSTRQMLWVTALVAVMFSGCAVAEAPDGVSSGAAGTQYEQPADNAAAAGSFSNGAAPGGRAQSVSAGGSAPAPGRTRAATASGSAAAPAMGIAASEGPDNSDVGVTATTIKVGAILPLSGPIGPYGKPWLEALQTPFRRANDQGGINGRKFEFTFCDDAFQGDRALACAKKLIDQDKVFAIMNPGSAGGSPAALPYIVQRKVPVGSALGFNPDEFTSPLVFPMTASGRTQGHLGERFIAKDLKVKKVGMIVLDNVEAATEVAAAFREAAKRDGLSLSEVSINFQDADCSTQMVQMQSRAPEAVFLATDASTAIKCFTAANNLGYKPPKQFVSPIPQYIDLIPQYGGAAAQGSYAMTVNNTPDTTSGGLVGQYLAETKTYYPGHKWWAETPAFYAGARLTVDVLRSLGRNVTRVRYMNGMNTVTDAFPGLGVDITYRPGPHDPNRQAAMLQLRGERFVPVTGFVRDDFTG